jgi:alkylation response protein AidB-like acyl-CoA dehydrogenase
VIAGTKHFNSGLHDATHDMIFARTAGEPGDAEGITCFIVPTSPPDVRVEFMWWTLNMPSDHAEVTLTDVRAPRAAIFGVEGNDLVLA